MNRWGYAVAGKHWGLTFTCVPLLYKFMGRKRDLIRYRLSDQFSVADSNMLHSRQ